MTLDLGMFYTTPLGPRVHCTHGRSMCESRRNLQFEGGVVKERKMTLVVVCAELCPKQWADPEVQLVTPQHLKASAGGKDFHLHLESVEPNLRIVPALRRPLAVDQDGDLLITMTVHGRSGRNTDATFVAEGSALPAKNGKEGRVTLLLQVWPKATSLHRRNGAGVRVRGSGGGGGGGNGSRSPPKRDAISAGGDDDLYGDDDYDDGGEGYGDDDANDDANDGSKDNREAVTARSSAAPLRPVAVMPPAPPFPYASSALGW